MVRVLAIGDAMESYEDYRCIEPTPLPAGSLILSRPLPPCVATPSVYKYPSFEKIGAEQYVRVPGYNGSGFSLTLSEPSDDIWVHTNTAYIGGGYTPELGATATFAFLTFVNAVGQPLIRFTQTVDDDNLLLTTTLSAGSLSDTFSYPVATPVDIDMHFAHGSFDIYIDGVQVPLSNSASYPLPSKIHTVIFGEKTNPMYGTTAYKFFVVGRDPMFGYEVKTVYPIRGSDFIDDWAPPSEAVDFTDRKDSANLIPYSSYIGRFNKAAQTFSFGPLNERMTIAATQLNGVFYGATEGVSTYFIESTFDNIVDLSTANLAGVSPTHVKQITTEPLHIDNEQTQFGFLMEKVE